MEVVTEKPTKKNIPKGYKQTEVGLIPEDWEVVKIGDFLSFKNGLNKAKKYFGSGTPIVNYMDVFKHSGLLGNDLEGKVTLSNKEIRRYEVKKGDVFFTRTSETVEEVGISAVMLEDVEDTVYSGFVLRGRPIDSVTDLYFRKYCFDSEIVRRQIKSSATHTTRALTNGGSLSKVQLPLPPTLEEQRAIAGALSDVDALIAKLNCLIEKKQQAKKGAMQQLLTGKKRLPSYKSESQYKETILGKVPSDWNSVEFQDVLQGFSSGATPYRGRPAYYEGDIRWITSSELNYGVINDTKEKITEEAVRKTNLKIHPPGTFLMAITGLEAEGTRGRCGIVGKEATTNQSCMALYPIEGEIISEYLFYFYQCYGDELAFKFCQGTKQQSYTAGVVKILPIHLPPTIEEQRAIAQILSDMDAEIQALQSKRDKYKKIKQGMMQKLLTGKTRLVETKEVESEGHNWQYDEAVILSVLVDRFGNPEYPLGRFRRTKLNYLTRRFLEKKVDRYLKKAAGPYSSDTRYKGPEGIALRKNYVEEWENEPYTGFIASDNVEEACTYFHDWYSNDVLDWIEEQFKFKDNDGLELITTVDKAIVELNKKEKGINLSNVKTVIESHPEWKEKLERDLFSDENIEDAIEESLTLFGK